MTIRRTISLLAVSIAIALGGLGMTAWYTESGSRVVVHRLIGLVPGLSVGEVSGTLGSKLRIDTISYRNSEITFSSQRGAFSLSLADLLRGRIVTHSITLTDVIVIYRSDSTPGPEPAAINIPVPVMLRQVDIAGAMITVNDLDPVQVEHVRASIELAGETLQLDVEHFDIGSLDLAGDLRFGLNAPFEFTAAIRTATTPLLPGLPEWSATASIHGSSGDVKVVSRMLAPEAVNVVARGEFTDGLMSLQVTADRFILADTIIGDARVNMAGASDALMIEASADITHNAAGTVATRLSGTRTQQGLTIESLNVSGQDIEIGASGDLILDDAAPILELTVSGVLHQQALRGTTRLTGSSLDTLDGRLDLAAGSNSLTVMASRGQLEASASFPDLATLLPGLGGHLNAAGSFSLPGGPVKFSGQGAPQYAEWTAGMTEISIEGPSLDEISGALKIGALAVRGDSMGRGSATWQGGLTNGDFALSWQHPDVAADISGQVSATGGAIDIDVTEASLSYQQLTWRLSDTAQGRVSEGLVSVPRLCLGHEQEILCLNQFSASSEGGNAILEGTIEQGGVRVEGLMGSVDWREQDGIKYRGEFSASRVSASGIDGFSQLFAVLEGNTDTLNFTARSHLDNPFISAQVSLQGVATAQELTGSALLESNRGRLETVARYVVTDQTLDIGLSGDIEQLEIEGEAAFSFDGPWVVGDTDIRLARSARLTASANAAGLVTVSFESDELSKLIPSLGGPLTMTGSVNQSDQSYEVLARSAELSSGTLSFDNLSLQGRGQATLVTDAHLTVDRIARNGEPFGRLDVSLQQQAITHEISLTYISEWLSLDLTSEATLGSDGASGTITHGEMVAGSQHWTLDTPVPFRGGPTGGSIEPHCWQVAGSSFCVTSAGFDEQHTRFAAHLRDAQIHLQELAFAPDVNLQAVLTADVEYNSSHLGASPRNQGTFTFELPSAEIRYFGDDAMNWTIKGRLGLEDNVVSGVLTGEVDAQNRFGITGRMPDVNSLDHYQFNANLTTDSLGVVTAFVPQLDRAEGNISASVSMDTTQGTPSASLTMTVGNDASVAIPAAGVVLRDLEVTAKGNAKRIVMTFDARSGDGTLSGKGAIIEPLSGERQLEIDLGADQFTAIKRPELTVVVSSDTTFRYQGAGTAQLAGKVTVNNGAFSLGDLDPAIVRQPSRDVVVVSRQTGAPLLAELDLNLAVDVERFALDLFGLNGNLAGAIAITQRPGNPRTTVGMLNLVDATFSRYGQSFDVERGRLIFSGPFANPTVDIIATRKIREPARMVSVSLLLSGPASNIRSTISSSPAMSEAQALSYLMLGRSLVGANADQGQTLAGAAVALGLRQASPITDEIRSALGLTELTIETGVDSTTVIAGRQLNPMLYVQYSYDVLGRIGGILFSYQLTDRLSLETKTGEENSAQLIYSF